MRTDHRLHIGDARNLHHVPDASVALVVTSPPYPMIRMWDDVFVSRDPAVGDALAGADGWEAFRRMHGVLDPVWCEVGRVLTRGGIACINIGDATRTVGDSFALYPNHSRVLSAFLELGFTPLPAILWRKPTNAPNKFMGSGMMPPGAYVTLEHEYVIVVRKGKKRPFISAGEKANRRASAFFWEERNRWYSDVWFDLRGTSQNLSEARLRERSGAFPFELPYRLISMFSVKGDTVLDPFLGTGTTTLAAMATGRSSVGCEIDPRWAPVVSADALRAVPPAVARIDERLRAHAEFVTRRRRSKGPFGYRNRHYGFPVVTKQETELLLSRPVAVEEAGELAFRVLYSDEPQENHVGDWSWFFDEPGRGVDIPGRVLNSE